MRTSPAQRSLKKLRSEGWTVAILERWNPWAKIRQDVFGFVDLLAVAPIDPSEFRKTDGGVLLVQTTSGSNVAARKAKIEANPNFRTCKRAGCRVEVHGWRKVGARGKRKIWECRVEEM